MITHTKSTGGIIETQNRTIEPIDNVSYWAKYDEEINKERNKTKIFIKDIQKILRINIIN